MVDFFTNSILMTLVCFCLSLTFFVIIRDNFFSDDKNENNKKRNGGTGT